MFTGIVEMIGEITHLEENANSYELTIAPATPITDIAIGDSIAINGVCLTVTKTLAGGFKVTVVAETLRRSNLRQLDIGSFVNLERSLRYNSRISGHFVQGHVDTVSTIFNIIPDGNNSRLLKIATMADYAKYIVNKGYITIDGMSLTVIEATPIWFTIALIPHTQKVTIAKHYQPGGLINIEVDILGKYIEKLMVDRLC